MAELHRLPDVAMAVLRRRSADDLPPVGNWGASGQDIVVAIGPDEWLVLAPDLDAVALIARCMPLGGDIVDVSGNRVRYRLVGDDAAWLLAGGCALDLERLEPGRAVSTLLARAQVIILREREGGMVVMPRRSFARYLEAWADVAA